MRIALGFGANDNALATDISTRRHIRAVVCADPGPYMLAGWSLREMSVSRRRGRCDALQRRT